MNPETDQLVRQGIHKGCAHKSTVRDESIHATALHSKVTKQLALEVVSCRETIRQSDKQIMVRSSYRIQRC
jgi:hypothetical protein